MDKNNSVKAWDARGRTGTITKGGYRMMMRDNIKEYEHRRVMEKLIGRKLRKGEIVHHKDHDRLNNDPGNLQLMTSTEHARIHAIERDFGQSRIGKAPPHKTSQLMINTIKKLRKHGIFFREIVRITGISCPTVYKYATET